MTLRIPFILAIFILSSFLPASSEPESVYLKQVSITKEKQGLFTVTASGMAPTPGWTVELVSATNQKAPEEWEINAQGTRPEGILPQVLKPWTASLQLSLEPATKRVTVKGKGKSITQDVPH